MHTFRKGWNLNFRNIRDTIWQDFRQFKRFLHQGSKSRFISHILYLDAMCYLIRSQMVWNQQQFRKKARHSSSCQMHSWDLSTHLSCGLIRKLCCGEQPESQSANFHAPVPSISTTGIWSYICRLNYLSFVHLRQFQIRVQNDMKIWGS